MFTCDFLQVLLDGCSVCVNAARKRRKSSHSHSPWGTLCDDYWTDVRYSLSRDPTPKTPGVAQPPSHDPFWFELVVQVQRF
jgi:hypothetical protein